MRKILLACLALAACSSPRYSYNFGYYKEGNGRTANTETRGTEKPVAENTEVVTASAEVSAPAVFQEEAPVEVKTQHVAELTKEQKKVLRKTIRTEITKQKEEIRKTNKTSDVKSDKKQKVMDNDLKLAAIFGAIGIVGLIISGDVFYIIGGLALIIGVVFFVMWLVRQ